MPIHASQSKIYESYAMLHPDGTLMCYCPEKKANWYVDRGLAEWEGESTFRLKFEPQGYGKHDNPYYTQRLENKCVVCGTEHRLNKHHVVPYVFRSRFPVKYKESNHHDILPICTECHERYEAHALRFKKELASLHGMDANPKPSPEERNNRKILSARALLEKINSGQLTGNNGTPIALPPERLAEVVNKAAEPLAEVPLSSGTEWADVIVAHTLETDSLEDFVREWRRHFVAHMSPQYLPPYWDPEGPLEAVAE